MKFFWWDENEAACNIKVLGPFTRHSYDFDDVTCDCCVIPRPPVSDERSETYVFSSNVQTDVKNNAQPVTSSETRAVSFSQIVGRKVVQTTAAAARVAVSSFRYTARAAVGGGALVLGDDTNPLVVAHYFHDYVNCKTLERDMKMKLGV